MGADGEVIANDPNVQPSYGSATFAQGTAYTWVASLPSDRRAMANTSDGVEADLFPR